MSALSIITATTTSISLEESLQEMMSREYIPTEEEFRAICTSGLENHLTDEVCQYIVTEMCDNQLIEILDVHKFMTEADIDSDIITQTMRTILNHWEMDTDQIVECSDEYYILNLFDNIPVEEIISKLSGLAVMEMIMNPEGLKLIKGSSDSVLKTISEHIDIFDSYRLPPQISLDLLELGIDVEVWGIFHFNHYDDDFYSVDDLTRVHPKVGLDLIEHFSIYENCTVQAYHYSVACALKGLCDEDELIEACKGYLRKYVEIERESRTDLGDYTEDDMRKMIDTMRSNLERYLVRSKFWLVESEFQNRLRDELLKELDTIIM
uniref:Uncharacterized protein n=1 Tax=viral metagenome TaxID=1070528 RepID=A0A6C0BMT1_9ZZZZ